MARNPRLCVPTQAGRQAGGRGGQTDYRLDSAAGLARRLVAHHVLIPLLQGRHTRCANPKQSLLCQTRKLALGAPQRAGWGAEATAERQAMTFRKVLTFSALNRQGEGVQDHKRVVLQLALQNAHHLDLSPGARVHGHLEERER